MVPGAFLANGVSVAEENSFGAGAETKSSEESLRESNAALLAANQLLERRVRDFGAELEKRSEKLRALARSLAEAESRERKRLSQLLHDHFQQLISAAKLKIGIMRRNSANPSTIESFRQTEALLEEALTSSRTLASELSPTILQDAGLGAAFSWLARHFEKSNQLLVNLKFDEHYSDPDDPQIQTVVFESVRELLFNVSRHAGVSSVDLSASVSAEGLLHIRVMDRGHGFDVASDESNSRLDGSFGLFSIRERLGNIGGLMKIVSAKGEGTCVDLSIPVRVAAAETSARAVGQSAPAAPRAEISRRVFRVVVADDHKIFRQGLITLLNQEPYLHIVGEANDGAEALELARTLSPDLMIMDVSMPRLSGVQATAILSHEFPQLKIIGLSMHEHHDMAKAMRRAGAIAYCVKNAPVETLVEIIREAAGEGELMLKG